MREFLDSLRFDAWSTSVSRFNASRRLSARDQFATLSISMFSAVGIALAFIQKAYAIVPGSSTDNFLTALAVCLGLFVLVIALVEWGAANGARARELYTSAVQLNEFQRKLEFRLALAADGSGVAPEECDAFRREYEELKGRCRFNHDPLDHRLFLAQQRESPDLLMRGHSKERQPAAALAYVQSFLSSVWFFGVLWVVIALLIFLGFQVEG
jgi:hypothetical protein